MFSCAFLTKNILALILFFCPRRRDIDYIFNATPEAPVVAAVFAAYPGAADTAVYYMEVHRDSS